MLGETEISIVWQLGLLAFSPHTLLYSHIRAIIKTNEKSKENSYHSVHKYCILKTTSYDPCTILIFAS